MLGDRIPAKVLSMRVIRRMIYLYIIIQETDHASHPSPRRSGKAS